MKTLTINGKDFAEAVKHTAYAIDKRDSRKVLHFLHIRRVDDQFARIEATDGRRLAMMDVMATGDADKLLLPPEFAKAIVAAKARSVTLSLANNGDLSSDPHVIPPFAMCDGDFPFVDMVTPKSFDLEVEFDIKSAKDAIKRCVAAAKAADYDKGDLSFESEKRVLLRISSDCIRIGSFIPGTPSVEIPAKATADEAYRGALRLPQTIGFTHRFLTNTLTGLKGKTALMKWNKPATPACFFSANDPVLGKLRLLMPTKLRPDQWTPEMRADLSERGLIAA